MSEYTDMREDIYEAIKTGWTMAGLNPNATVKDAMELAVAKVMKVVHPEGEANETDVIINILEKS